MGSHDLWTGGVSDTHYMLDGKVFDSLNECLSTSPNEDEASKLIPYTILLDKGYRVTTDARDNGGHSVVQPIVSGSDRRFTTVEVIVTTNVASGV
jgi:hypothetical protein